jgi:formamidopyrimidine-DNA glycosylase
MPELPEVQTIVSDLKKILPGLAVKDAWTDWPKMFKNSVFKKEILGGKIISAGRVGKNILIGLKNGKTILVHQKMTGHLLYGNWKMKNGKWVSAGKGAIKDDPRNGYLHLVFSLSNGKQLALSDVRKFAKVLLFDTEKIGNVGDVKNIGIDPTDKKFTYKKFREIFSGKKGKIKEILMEQELVSGIGNIYASEILWEAGVYPFRELQSLSENEFKKIYKYIKIILSRAIKARGDSLVDYRDIYGEKGGYQKLHRAYMMEGKPCAKKDGGTIKRIKKGARSAYFCPVHQI